jgi:hypothetical protein
MALLSHSLTSLARSKAHLAIRKMANTNIASDREEIESASRDLLHLVSVESLEV